MDEERRTKVTKEAQKVLSGGVLGQRALTVRRTKKKMCLGKRKKKKKKKVDALLMCIPTLPFAAGHSVSPQGENRGKVTFCA